MNGPGEIIEILIRGANVGASLLLAGALLAWRPFGWRRVLGALFSVSAAAYVLGSSPTIAAAMGVWLAPVRVLATVAPVIFWWFALALFDDRFAWRWPAFAPFALIMPVIVTDFFFREGTAICMAAMALNRAAQIFVFSHAIYVAARYAGDDLIEGRRRFRGVFAIAVALTGLVIAYVEMTGVGDSPSRALLLFQAADIFLMTLGFGLWLIAARPHIIDGDPAPAAPGIAAQAPGAASGLRAADRPAYETLMALMRDGAWREEGLTVAGLAAKVGLPEHQFRRLINGGLGFRNFSAFLNSFRIEDAKAALADPAEARKQILQIALDLGYGSIAPFNRAFKEATDLTPTEFRKKALGED